MDKLMTTLSVRHLTPDTLKRLKSGDPTVNVAGSLVTMACNHDNTGVMVNVYKEDIERDEPGIPEDLLRVLRYAITHKVDCVLFDQDADRNPELPIYDQSTVPVFTVKDLIRELTTHYSPDAEVVVVDWSKGATYTPSVGGDDEDEGSKYCRIGY